VKYLILIYGNPVTRKMWEGFSDAQRAEGWRAHNALRDDLAASGQLVMSQALEALALGKLVSVSEGRTMTTDGPFGPVGRRGHRGRRRPDHRFAGHRALQSRAAHPAPLTRPRPAGLRTQEETAMHQAETRDHGDRSLPADLSKPAQRALSAAGYTGLDQLTDVTEAELLRLHGMGPKAIEQLRRALAACGLSFAARS
jgi:hypothetical protein